jgi:hypothetical protein
MNRRVVAFALDVAAVLLFVVAGRDSHSEDGGTAEVLTIAAPFLIGLAVAWIASPHLRNRPTALRAGADGWVSTVAIGMLLRRFAWHRGTALPFVIVASLMLGALLLGWRWIWSIAHRRVEIRSARPPSKAGR